LGPEDVTENLTQTGSALGTPAYMSPEQAEGRWSAVGPLADVFALGATLYSLLTGRAPYSGPTAISDARLGHFKHPRQIDPELSPALEATCLKAMAARTGDRYQSALELATDVERWLASEPVRAYPEPWSDRARRWLRRHRTIATLIMGIVATGVVTLAIATILLGRAHRQTTTALEQSRALLDRMLRRIGEDDAWLRQSPRVNRLRLDLLREALAGYRDLLAQSPEDDALRRSTAQTLRRAGDVAAELALFDEARTDYGDAERILRNLQHAREPNEQDLVNLGECLNSQGNLASSAGDRVVAEERHKSALVLREQLAARDPSRLDYRRDVARSLINIGNATRQLGSSRDADTEAAFRRAVEQCRELVRLSDGRAVERRLLALALNNKGLFFRDLQRIDEAKSDLDESLRMRLALAVEFPENPDMRNDVAGTLGNLGVADLRAGKAEIARARFDEARPHSDAALKASPDHPTYRLFARNNAVWRATAVALLGDHAAAADDAERVVKAGQNPARDAADAAAVLIRCAAAAAKDQAINESERRAMSDRYRRRALELAGRARQSGLDTEQIRRDPDLLILFENSDIRAVLEKPR
jgi:serine/threonine protein kinase